MFVRLVSHGHDGWESDVETLRNCWSRWTAIVELFARRRPERRGVNPAAYAELYHQLIAECRRAAASASDQRRWAYFLNLEVTIQPWLNPRTLGQADREILTDLLSRCRQVERDLGVSHWHMPVLRRLVRLSLLAAVVASVIALLVYVQELGMFFVPSPRRFFELIWLAIKRSSELDRFLVVVILVLVFSIVTVSRTTRS